ncbi:MAG: hypothetical protein JOZ46_12480 [Candidatus Dormibacteraeota bacterium]|nr:hypothetical protein [Candidatus Dormibacteraeota bacterium]MBV9526617.1 hypothetical protein [Candidatus Dormibacteraeota bacterium]
MPDPEPPDDPALPPGWGSDASYSWQAPPSPPPWPPGGGAGGRRMRPLFLVLAIAGLVLVAGGIGAAATLVTRGHSVGTTGPSTAPPSASPNSAAAVQARQLFQRALSAMRASSGFHYVAVTNGPESQRIEGDAGRDQGTQLITFNSTYGAEQFTLVLSSGTVYFQGNVPAVQDQLGVSAAAAPGVAGKWISVVRGDGPYNVLQPGITVSDQAQETALVPASTQRVSAPDGSGATRIAGTVPAQNGAPGGTGYVDIATSTGLPLEYVTTISAQGVSLNSTATFSRWGSAPTVTVPSGATPWSTLGATTPPGGYGSGGGTGGGGPSQTPGVNV